jgi:hypothetical protein
MGHFKKGLRTVWQDSDRTVSGVVGSPRHTGCSVVRTVVRTLLRHFSECGRTGQFLKNCPYCPLVVSGGKI